MTKAAKSSLFKWIRVFPNFIARWLLSKVSLATFTRRHCRLVNSNPYIRGWQHQWEQRKAILIGLAQQNNNFASASCFLVHFVVVIAHFVISNFLKVVTTRQQLSLSFSKLGYGTYLFTYINSKTFTNTRQIEGGGIKGIQVFTATAFVVA